MNEQFNLHSLTLDFCVQSARYLTCLPSHHPCSQMHGNTFQIKMKFKGPLDPKMEWLIDYHQLKEQLNPLIQSLDHQILNKIPGLENPTSEKLCEWMYKKGKEVQPLLCRVEISEVPGLICAYPETP